MAAAFLIIGLLSAVWRGPAHAPAAKVEQEEELLVAARSGWGVQLNGKPSFAEQDLESLQRDGPVRSLKLKISRMPNGR